MTGASPAEPDPGPPRRPRDLALLRLAAESAPPRRRARDARADLAGLAIRRRVLDRIAALDPEPEALDEALARVVADLGEPTGPARSACALFRDEWAAALGAPALWPWLVAEALAAGRGQGDAP